MTQRFTCSGVFDAISSQVYVKSVFSVIDVYHLFFFSVFFPPCHMQASKWKDLAGPEWQLLSWQADALHICLSYFQRYQLRISFCVLQTSQTPFPPVTFLCDFRLFKNFAENYGSVWTEIALFRGAPKCWRDAVSWWKWYLQSNAGQMLQSLQFLMVCFDTVLGCLGKRKKKKSYFVLMW